MCIRDRIVLDPSRFGKQLGEFALRDRPNQPFAVEYDRTGAARALIQCQNVLFHMLVFLCCFLRPARGCRPLRLQIYQKNLGFETKPRSFFSKLIPRKKPTAGPGKAAAQADRLPFPCLHAVGLKPDISSGTCSHLRKCKNLAYRRYTRFLHVCPPSQGFKMCIRDRVCPMPALMTVSGVPQSRASVAHEWRAA